MDTLEQARVRVATTFNAASDTYDHDAITFWERFGRHGAAARPGDRIAGAQCLEQFLDTAWLPKIGQSPRQSGSPRQLIQK